MGKKVVVIGGVACGPKAACRLKRLDPDAEITILEKGSEISYGACGLPFYLDGEVQDVEQLTHTPVGIPRNAGFFQAVKGVRVLTRTEAISIDRDNKVVKARDLEKDVEFEIPWDNLVLATGSVPARPPIPGIDLPGIHFLKTLSDGARLKRAMEEAKTRKAVIVGAGLIGLECVEPLASAGFEVHVVEKLPWVLPTLLDQEMAAPLEGHLRSKDIHLHLGVGVTSFEGGQAVEAVVTEAGRIEAGLVLLAIGVRPETSLAEAAGLEVSPQGIVTDERMRTSDPDIFAGGDCVASRHLVTGELLHVPMGSTANKHGRIIADNLAGLDSSFPGVCGTTVCNVYGFNVARTGITEQDAKGLGLEAITALSPGPDRPHYMKAARPIFLKLIAEQATGRILGLQVLGPGEVLSRVDTVAALMRKGATVDDLATTDMAYAPPYSPAVDNLIVAANIVQNKRDGLITALSPKEVKAKLDAGEDFVLLDVRTPGELEQIRLPYDNVVHIPLGMVRKKLEELPKDKEIVCLCKISLRGYEAARMLLGAGFDPGKVKLMDGGIMSWPYEKKTS